MAALRQGLLNIFRANAAFPSFVNLQKRNVLIGDRVNDPLVLPRSYEISKNPEEWKYVQKLLNKSTVPPFIEKTEYPSGWRPPQDKSKDLPYFVERNKNHMLSLYLHNCDRGQLKITVIKRIQGDIWKLHNDVKQYIEENHGKKVPSQVLECNSIVKIKGDHYHWVEQWLYSKGF